MQRTSGVFYTLKNTHLCYMKFDIVNISHTSVRFRTKFVSYRNQFVKFCSECEIYEVLNLRLIPALIYSADYILLLVL